MKLSALSVKRPVAVIMAVLVFVVIGLYSLTMLPIEMMPDMELPMAAVITQYNNVGAEEVENLVTKTIESSLSSVSGVSSITSQSSQGLSLVMIEFDTGIDIDDAVLDMKDKISLIESYLPDGVEDPMVLKLDTSMMAAAQISVTYEGYDNIQTKKFVEDNVVNRLEGVAGVASVSVAGAEERQIEIVVSPEKMFGYNMSFDTMMGMIAVQNQNLAAGSTTSSGRNMNVRTLNKFESIYDIERVPLNTGTGQVIYLKDVADVKDTYSDTSSYARINNQAAISISITQESDANTVDVINKIFEVLDSVSAENPKFEYTTIYEQGSYIENAVGSVAENAVVGAVLAIVILLLFLGSFKTSMVIGLTMPVSVITTFIVMYFSGMSLNIVSLGGLALGVGMLVDNAVVVIENIFRRRNELGEDRKTAAIKGAGEVMGAVIASVLTTCIVYVPILFINNIVAEMFKQLAFSIIFSQIASLVVTFLLVPMLSSKIETTSGTKKRLAFIFKPVDKFLDWVYRLYEKCLRIVLKKRKRFVCAVLAVFMVAMVVLANLGMTLMPSSDEGTISVSVELPNGSKLEESDMMAREAEQIIFENENVETVFTTVGSNSMSSIMGSSENTASISVILKEDRKKSTNEVMEELRKALSNMVGAEVTLDASSTAMSSMSSDEVEFSFSSTDSEKLEEFVLEAEKMLQSIDSVTETETSIADKKSEIQIIPNIEQCAKYGLTTTSLNTSVARALSATTVSRLTDNGSEYDIVLKYPDSYVEDLNQLKTLRIQTPTGSIVTLNEVAEDIKIAQGTTTLTRVDQKRTVTLTGKFYDDNMQSVTNKFNALLDEKGLPEGITMVESGTYEIMIDAMQSLVLAIILGIVLMYMVMAAQFESLRDPFIILFTVPLAMIGVVLSLVVGWQPLSVIGCVGILMLMGIIVNNAIVLIDFIKTLSVEKPEMSRMEIIVESCKTRLRPILMTTLTSILGFMPMAFSTADGSEMMRPLASVLLGGLGVGSLLTLFFIPVMYSIFDDRRIKREKKKALRQSYKKALES